MKTDQADNKAEIGNWMQEFKDAWYSDNEIKNKREKDEAWKEVERHANTAYKYFFKHLKNNPSPVGGDNISRGKAIDELQKFYNYGKDLGYSNSELSRITSCIEKIKWLPASDNYKKLEEVCKIIAASDVNVPNPTLTLQVIHEMVVSVINQTSTSPSSSKGEDIHIMLNNLEEHGRKTTLGEEQKLFTDEKFLLHLIDITWNEANEDQSVPSTKWAKEIIEKAKQTFNQ